MLVQATSSSSSTLLGLVPLAALGAAYWLPYRRRVRTLAAQGRPVPGWRRGCFAAGLVVLLLSLLPPVERLADQLLVAHMVEHLLIGDIAALLLVLGLTGPVLQPILHLPWVGAVRALANPAVALPLWVADLYVWHLPVLYQAALRHPPVHVLQHLMFLGLGVNMWLALLGPLPKPRWFGNLGRLGYVIGVRLAGAVLGNVLLWSGTVFYPYYARGEAGWGISGLQDQTLAGAVMMVEGSFLTLGLFAWLFLRSAREGEERQALLDLAATRGVALSEERAARAVSAGRGRELRERLERAAT
jgi:cytochrome c oxidase assembly factor CtaG